MTLNNEVPSLYEVLDLTPDASPQEVREAYLRAKAAYGKDSVALYSLISPQEREETLTRINEAYEILSNSDRRKAYDRNHGLIDAEHDFSEPIPRFNSQADRKIISIDRVPPMENLSQAENLLVAPNTDFGSAPPLSMPPINNTVEHAANPPQASPRKPTKEKDTALDQEIAQEVEWKGIFLRSVREARRISIEDLSNTTKISKTYLTAIEEENYAKLPAAVFIRGFVTQLAKALKLPHDQVTAAYMARYQQARTDKNGK